MYSNDGHKQKHQTKHNTQKAAWNQPTGAQKKPPTLTLPNMAIQSEKINKFNKY
jgi:hypothetical protein